MIGLNDGPVFQHSEAFSFQIAMENQEETDRYWNAIRQWWEEKRLRPVQGQVGRQLADHAAGSD
jgi:predicted 3-demethylubiquinone-9 3-methyltransferase (glyoxalase superfamily)